MAYGAATCAPNDLHDGTGCTARRAFARSRRGSLQLDEALRAGALRRGNGQGQAVQLKSPEGFRMIGRSLRQDFSAMSDMAMTADMDELQLLVSDAMGKCAACHGSYKAVEVEEPAAD